MRESAKGGGDEKKNPGAHEGQPGAGIDSQITAGGSGHCPVVGVISAQDQGEASMLKSSRGRRGRRGAARLSATSVSLFSHRAATANQGVERVRFLHGENACFTAFSPIEHGGFHTSRTAHKARMNR